MGRKLFLLSIIVGLLGLVWLVWLQQVDQDTRSLPPPENAVPLEYLPPGPVPEPIRLSYHGDPGNFSSRSRVYERLRPDARKSFLALANAGAFGSRYVGASGRPTPYARDLDTLAAEAAATDAFAELVQTGAPAGRIYGLCGLYLTDLPRFFAARDDLSRADELQLTLFIGCFPRKATVGEIARELQVGCGALGV